MAEAKKTETYTAAAEEQCNKCVATQSAESEMQSDSNTQQIEKVALNLENAFDAAAGAEGGE